MLAAVTGILMFTSEAQHGTLAVRPDGAARPLGDRRGQDGHGGRGRPGPRRHRHGAGVVGAVAGGLEMGDTSAMAATTLWALLYIALAALIGLGVGMIVRHSAGAISGLLVWSFVVENLLSLFVPAEVARFLPFCAGTGLLAVDSDIASPEPIAVALARPRTPSSSAATPPSPCSSAPSSSTGATPTDPRA